MSNELAPLRGMKDLLPDDYRAYKYIENTAFNISKLYGFEGFSTPIIEYASVFDRTLGSSSDVVSKEMYSFSDKKGRLLSLRPEFTAAIMRAIISNGLKQTLPLKLFSSGPLFRYDRPQEGRQRQFHQLNFENIGVNTPYSDAEMIALATHIIRELGVLDDVTLELNSLGCTQSRQIYQASLVEYFSQYASELSFDSQKRLTQNPMRILDSKDENDKKIIAGAPLISSFYTDAALSYFNNVQQYLNDLNIKYLINEKIVRGLDYYSQTAFEFTTSKLGAQTSIVAGGRYDKLSCLMGEKSEIPSIGFAIGVERVLLLKNFKTPKERSVFIIPLNQNSFDQSIQIAQSLRVNNIATNIEFTGKINKRMQTAINANARYIIFIGDDEIRNNTYKLKDLDSSTEQEVNYENLMSILKYNSL
ncbi:MAG: histidine--tRNA ligase [Rickettsiales bacterium]|nr:MAG: histidine--tRNA ligase [Rickettsiales bacterium]